MIEDLPHSPVNMQEPLIVQQTLDALNNKQIAHSLTKVHSFRSPESIKFSGKLASMKSVPTNTSMCTNTVLTNPNRDREGVSLTMFNSKSRPQLQTFIN